MDMLDKRMIHILSGIERDSARSHQATLNSTEFKMYKLFISESFQLILSESG